MVVRAGLARTFLPGEDADDPDEGPVGANINEEDMLDAPDEGDEAEAEEMDEVLLDDDDVAVRSEKSNG